MAISLVFAPACSDVVVGQFDGSSSSDGASTSSATVTGDTATPETTAADETGSGVPYTCFSDDFEDGVIDETMWNTWVEEDSAVEELIGQLKFTPPSSGVFDTGVVGNSSFAFPFTDGRIRVRIVTPPPFDRPAGLFLLVGQQPDTLLINVGSGEVSVRQSISDVPSFSESFPVEEYPDWLGIRSEDSVIYFETSDDGQNWTTISTYEQEQPFTDARGLIMAQTYGENPEQATITVDDFEVCYR